MLIIVSVMFAAYVLGTFIYIRKLKQQLHIYEKDWDVIEEMADHNKDGDVIIHVRHTGTDHVSEVTIEDPRHQDGRDRS